MERGLVSRGSATPKLQGAGCPLPKNPTTALGPSGLASPILPTPKLVPTPLQMRRAVCQLHLSLLSEKFYGKVVDGPCQKPLGVDFDGNSR